MRNTGWVTASPGRALWSPGTRRSPWLPRLRRGEITRKATERRRVEGRRVSRSLERRGGKGRPRRRSASAPCSPLHQGRRRGSPTGGTRQGTFVDVMVPVIKMCRICNGCSLEETEDGVTNLSEMTERSRWRERAMLHRCH